MSSKLLSANATPRGTVKQFFIDLGDSVEKVVERLAVDFIKGAVKYLYQKSENWLRRPKHHAVDGGTIHWHFSLPEPKVTVVRATDTKAVD